MKKISNIMNRLVSRKENAEKNENGFSLLELVVAIGILLVLTVGGLIGYSAITNNARSAANQTAVSEISTKLMIELTDGKGSDDLVEAKKIVADNAGSYKDITVDVVEGSPAGSYTVTATHSGGGTDAERTVTP